MTDEELIRKVIHTLHQGLDADRAEKVMLGIWKGLSDAKKAEKREKLKLFLKE